MIRRTFLKMLAALPLLPLSTFSHASHRPVPRTCSELYGAMCAALPVGERTVVKWSVTGEEYVEYVLGVNLAQAKSVGVDPEAAACRALWYTFLAQLDKAPRGSRLYWRVPPEFAAYEDAFDDGKPKARIYALYLISSGPVLMKASEVMNHSFGQVHWRPA